jgi:hypothetical protein
LGLFEKGLGSGEKIFPNLNLSDVARIDLLELAGAVVIVKKNGDWQVYGEKIKYDTKSKIPDKDEPGQAKGKKLKVVDEYIFKGISPEVLNKNKIYNTSQKLVDDMLKLVSEIKEVKVISQNTERLNVFKVGKEFEVAFRAWDKNGKELASLVIGKSSSDYMSQYFREKGKDKVMISGKPLIFSFKKSPSEWREKTIMAIVPNEIESYGFSFGGKEIRLKLIQVETKSAKAKVSAKDATAPVKKESKWQFEMGNTGFAQKGVLDSMVRFFANLRAAGFIDEDGFLTKKKITKAKGSVWAKTKNGATYKIESFGFTDLKKTEIIIKKEGTNQLYTISNNDWQRLVKDIKEIAEAKNKPQK